MTVVETPFFLRKAATLLDEEERSEDVLLRVRRGGIGVRSEDRSPPVRLSTSMSA